MEFNEQVAKVDLIRQVIIALKDQPQTPKTKLRIQKLQQEIDNILGL